MHLRARATVITTVALAAVLSTVLSTVLSGCGTTPSAAAVTEPPLGYRSVPAYLSTVSAAPVDQVMIASAGHPQLAVQGVAVRVALPSGTALMNVVGPTVPPFVAPPPPTVRTTFTITLDDVSGQIPVRLSEFTITDQFGHSFDPTLVAGEAALPPTVAAGGHLTFQVTGVMPTGEGRLHWTPRPGIPLVSWDFVVEND